MKAYRAHRLGGPQVLKLEDADEPAPGPQDVVIAVEAVGLQLADLATLSGDRPPRPKPPFTPGLEVAGRIVALGEWVGEQAKGPELGSRVAGFVPWGGLAERVATRWEACAAIPDALTAAQAAALPFAYGGALMALGTKAGLKKGQTVLVLGAGGPLGLAAVAVAKALGATVVAAANGAARLAHALEMGADQIVDAGLVSIASAVEERTGGRGADVVFDPVGGDVSALALQALAPAGRYVLAGFASGRPSPLDAGQIYARGATVLAANTVLSVERDPAAAGKALARAVAWAEKGVFVPRIAAQFTFAEALPAFDYLAGRRGSGATIVTLASS
jgi:NADPH2:quinone reductase